MRFGGAGEGFGMQLERDSGWLIASPKSEFPISDF
jgi:hypothetical protein